jgi:hypothetical protein
MSVARLNAYYDVITEMYDAQAKAILSNDLDGITSLHTKDFFAVPLDGSKRSAEEWAASVKREMEQHEYRQVTYEIEKITTNEDNNITVFVTRRCAGVNSEGKAFNTEVSLQDIFTGEGGDALLMRRSETVSRKLWLNGNRVQVERIPEIVAMVQGCSDWEKVN